MICLNDVFLRKSMTGVALNTSPNVLLIVYLMFTKVGLFVTENGITFFGTVLVLFNRADLSVKFIHLYTLFDFAFFSVVMDNFYF